MQTEAMETIRVALEGLESTLGSRHPYTLAAAMVLGSLLADQGNLEAAERMEAKTLQALAITLGQNHPDTLRCHANMLLTRQQRGEDHTGQREMVIDQLANLIGLDHPNVGTLRGGRRLMRALDPQPF